MSTQNATQSDKQVTIYDPDSLPLSVYGVDLSGLPQKQRVFVILKTQGFSDEDAYQGAGYLKHNSTYDVRAIAYAPKVREALIATIGGQIEDGASYAIEYLNKVVKDETMAPKLRAEVAKTLLDRAGYLPPTKDERRTGDTLAEMTPDQLRTFISEAERKLSDKAIVIDGDAVATQSDTKAASFLD